MTTSPVPDRAVITAAAPLRSVVCGTRTTVDPLSSPVSAFTRYGPRGGGRGDVAGWNGDAHLEHRLAADALDPFDTAHQVHENHDRQREPDHRGNRRDANDENGQRKPEPHDRHGGADDHRRGRNQADVSGRPGGDVGEVRRVDGARRCRVGCGYCDHDVNLRRSRARQHGVFPRPLRGKTPTAW